MNRKKDKLKVVVLANGEFPTRGKALKLLEQADLRICCDGAADKLMAAGWQADVIIGDLDSLSPGLRREYQGELHQLDEQDSNDLTKAVHFCHDRGYEQLTILGATGMREDHTLGNISLLLEYAWLADVCMVSDHGEFFLARSGEEVACIPGEHISIFSPDKYLKVNSKGLKFPLDKLQLSHWYTASLNQASASSFSLSFASADPLIIYRSFT